MFDARLHDYWEPPRDAASRSLLDELGEAQRRENRESARRLRICGELFEMRRRQRGESEDWAVDTWAAVGAEIAAVLRISLGRAGSCMSDGLAMRRLPSVAAVFESGDVDLHMYRTIVYRTGLITDETALNRVDVTLAARIARWPSMTQGRLIREIDRVIGAVDPDAVRRARERVRDRDVTVWDAVDGVADLSGRMFAADAHLLDRKLTALAGTVCEADPRTLAQRRADALGALAGGAQRLICRCGAAGCPATATTGSSSALVIHVVAEQETLDGRSEKPGYLLGADAVIPAEVLRELAATARRRPLSAPIGAAAETGYRPSRALADFVRARDVTCRAPACDRPATECDLDHTVPYPYGPTHASNIKALCRFHHILKTFWGWRDEQLPDGTVVWTLPDSRRYVTTPGSALLFPSLMVPTGPLVADLQSAASGKRMLAMPRRRGRTRAQNRALRIARERAGNRCLSESRRTVAALHLGYGPDPPPF